MIANKHRRAGCVQVVVRVVNGEGYASGKPHNVFEAARGSPLRDASVADQTEEYGDDDAIQSAYYEGDVGGEETTEEPCCWNARREHVEEEDEAYVSAGEQVEVIGD